MSQSSTNSHLMLPGAKRKFIGLSHIEVDLGQKNTLIIGFDRFAQVQARPNVDSVLRLFVADFRKVDDSTQSSTRATHALFKLGETDRSLVFRHTPESTTAFRFSEGDEPILLKTRQDTLQVVWVSSVLQATPDDFSVYLLINNLHDIDRLLRNGGVNQKLQTALESVRQYKGHDLTSPKMAFNVIQNSDAKATFLAPGLARSPFLSIQPGIGVGLIRGQWASSFNLDLQFIPSRFHRISYGVGYTSNFFFSQQTPDGALQAFRNDFLNVGVAFYRSHKESRGTAFDRQLASFYVGIPVYRRGGYFSSNTIRLGGTVYQNGLFKVQPEMYMNGFFRKVSPGLRVVVGF
ncbi:hypothetical protein [Spirosoma fluviale]|nr:hypothetical protein [Spirosoma fluviale]